MSQEWFNNCVQAKGVNDGGLLPYNIKADVVYATTALDSMPKLPADSITVKLSKY
jgi:hypothetical protein